MVAVLGISGSFSPLPSAIVALWRLGNGNLGLSGTPSDLPDKVANHRGHQGTVHFHPYMEQAVVVMRVWEPEDPSCCTPSGRFPPIQMYPACSLQCVCE